MSSQVLLHPDYDRPTTRHDVLIGPCKCGAWHAEVEWSESLLARARSAAALRGDEVERMDQATNGTGEE